MSDFSNTVVEAYIRGASVGVENTNYFQWHTRGRHSVGKCWRGRSNSNSTKCLVRQHKANQGVLKAKQTPRGSQGQANTKGFSRPSKTQGIPKFNLEENTKCGSLASPALRKKNERMERGGTNRSDIGLNLSGSWQQGHSATYNTPSRI